jgi:hypothetical protein
MPKSFSPAVRTLIGLRVLTALAATMVALALSVFKSSPAHEFCVGLALGLLVGLCVISFGIKDVVLQDTAQPSDVHRYPIT